MEAKKYLTQILQLDRRMEKLKRKSEAYGNSAATISATRYDKPNVMTSPQEPDFVNKLLSKYDVDTQITELEAQRERVMATAIDRIEALTDEDYKTVLVLRYFRGLHWDEIAEKLCVSERTAYHWHNKALGLLGEF